MTKILTVNDAIEDKFLRKVTAPFDFKAFSRKEINQLIQTMRRDMEVANGVGLSANQIGIDTQLFVARDEQKFYAIFNPKIIKPSKETIDMEEGCLSIPENFKAVERPERVTLVGYDKNGKKIKINAWGFLARVFQHEVDHLNGKVFTDHLK